MRVRNAFGFSANKQLATGEGGMLIPRDADMTEKARALAADLRRSFSVEHDDSGQIGRRYRRQDEIGTPWALTVDEQTLEDGTVTIRDRDSLAQERIPLEAVRAHLAELLEAPFPARRSR